VSQMCQKVSMKLTQPIKTENNMEVSYQYKEIKIRNKRPSKE